jgi:hypothetical protein
MEVRLLHDVVVMQLTNGLERMKNSPVSDVKQLSDAHVAEEKRDRVGADGR